MNGLLLVARLVGGLGVVACIVAVLLRLAGHYYVVGDLSSGTLLQGGMAAMLIGCFGLLLVLAGRKG